MARDPFALDPLALLGLSRPCAGCRGPGGPWCATCAATVVGAAAYADLRPWPDGLPAGDCGVGRTPGRCARRWWRSRTTAAGRCARRSGRRCAVAVAGLLVDLGPPAPLRVTLVPGRRVAGIGAGARRRPRAGAGARPRRAAAAPGRCRRAGADGARARTTSRGPGRARAGGPGSQPARLDAGTRGSRRAGGRWCSSTTWSPPGRRSPSPLARCGPRAAARSARPWSRRPGPVRLFVRLPAG